MTTPILQIPEASTSILSFSLLNIILRHYEQSSLKNVLGIVASPPVSPGDGDAYIVAASGTTGVFVGQENNLAFSIQGAWYFLANTADNAYTEFIDSLTGVRYVWDGTALLSRIPTISQAISSATSNSFDLTEFASIDATAASLTFTANTPLPFGFFTVYNNGANSFDLDLDGGVFSVSPATTSRFYISEAGVVWAL